MMNPSIEEAVDAIVLTLENEVAPHIDDELATSLCRTVCQMLRSVQVRVNNETAYLHQDNIALRALLRTWGSGLSEHLHQQLLEAVAAAPSPAYPSLDDLRADATRLRGALVAAIESEPDSNHDFRKAARDYIQQQLAHEKVWMQDAFTGPRR